MKLVGIVLALFAPLAAFVIAHPAAPLPLSSCEGVITVDEQGDEPLIFHSCLNSGCSAGCTMATVSIGTETGQTCSCQGQVPSCCHLVFIDNDPMFDIAPTGNCGSQEMGCPNGNKCKALWRIIEEGYYEVQPNCIQSQG